MADIKELFDMVTKQTEPDLGSWKEQEDRQRKRARGRRVGAFAVAAAIVAVGALAVATLYQSNDTSPPLDGKTDTVIPPVTAVYEYVTISTGESSPVLADMFGARLPEVSPDGRRIVYGTCCAYDSLYVENLDGSDRTKITSSVADDLDGYAATWVDNETILFQGRATGTDEIGDLYVKYLPTGDTSMAVDLPNTSNGRWIIASDTSPDRTTVLFHLPRGNGEDGTWDLWTAPLAGGEATLLRRNAGFAQYGPDGSIVFLDHPAGFAGEEIWIMDADGNGARRLVKSSGGIGYTWPRFSPDGTKIVFGNDETFVAEVFDLEGGGVSTIAAIEENTEPAWFGNGTLILDETTEG
jgi:Tol biopolymer transport system component